MENDYYELKCKAIKYDSLMLYLDKLELIYQNAVEEHKTETLKEILKVIKIIKL